MSRRIGYSSPRKVLKKDALAAAHCSTSSKAYAYTRLAETTSCKVARTPILALSTRVRGRFSISMPAVWEWPLNASTDAKDTRGGPSVQGSTD